MFRRYVFTLFMMVAVLITASVFISTSVDSLWYVPDAQISVPQVEPEEDREVRPEDHPARLRIPVLAINALVQDVGVTALGNMATPNNFTDVGWYKYGTPPGFKGSAVIAGHVDNGLALAGVFKHLNEVSIGDDIYIEQKDGDELHFKVVEIQTYPYTHVPRDILFSRNDSERLNLITCEGAWVQGERTYDQRLVVYADLVAE